MTIISTGGGDGLLNDYRTIVIGHPVVKQTIIVQWFRNNSRPESAKRALKNVPNKNLPTDNTLAYFFFTTRAVWCEHIDDYGIQRAITGAGYKLLGRFDLI